MAVLGLVAASCGPPPAIEGLGGGVVDGKLPDCPAEALAKAKGKVKVVLWHGLGVTPLRALEDMVSKYNASQDKVEIVALQQGTSYDEVLRKYEAASATGGLPGIVFTEDTTLQTMVDSGTIFPAQACMEATGFDFNRISESVRNYYTTDGAYWPGYANVSGPVLYFNRAHFEKAGLDPSKPPQTLEEMRDVARVLKDKAGIEHPIALKLDEWYFECWLTGAGEQVVNKNNGRDGRPTKANVDNPTAVKILKLLREMKDEGLLQAFSDTDGQVNQFFALASQESSMTIETSTAATSIKAFLGGDLEEAPAGSSDAVNTSELIPEAAPFPGVEGSGHVRVSGGGYFIVNGTKSDPAPPEQIAAAWDFFQFMMKPENVVQQHITGSYLPVVSPAQDEPEVKKFWTDDIAGKMLRMAFAQLSDIDPNNPGPVMGPYPQYVEALRTALDQAVLNGMDPKEALATANEEITAELQASQ